MRPFQVSTGLALIAISFLSGCGINGIKTYPVRGQVVFSDDSPVKFGRIEFYHPEHDLNSRGAIQPDGSFVLGTYSNEDGAPAGTHDVAITQLIMSGQAGGTPHEHGRHINSRYHDYDTSGITLTVQASKNNEFRIVVEAVQARSRRR